jgi:hypothetical protein
MQLVDRLTPWDGTFYCTDRWKSYAAMIPAEKFGWICSAHQKWLDKPA